MPGTILLIILVLLLIGALPRWGNGVNRGYGPSGALTLVVIVPAAMVFTGRL